MQKEDGAERVIGGWLTTKSRAALLLAGLCVIAYLPAFNNGFISDDYVILGRLDPLAHNWLYLFSVPPECFRLTSYLFFELLRFLFGYHSGFYYAFSLLLHFINSLLLWKLLTRISQSSGVGLLAGVLFATVQGHQEAMMWLAAMNEALLGLCLLAGLLLWENGRPIWSAATYVAALFSKESALIFVALLPLLMWRSRGLRQSRRSYVSILGISAAFVGLFYRLAGGNFMLGTRTYALTWHAVPVFLWSMHRLLFPWMYAAVVIHLVQRSGLANLKSACRGLAFATLALLPYVFLTYQSHVPSRQEYLPSIGIAWSLAILIQGMKNRKLRHAFLLIFVVANVSYIWIKDRQFEQRAAPTRRLIEMLKERTPQNIAIYDFPANPWIAKVAAGMAPGWHPDMIHVNPPASECTACPGLRWDARAERYYAVNQW